MEAPGGIRLRKLWATSRLVAKTWWRTLVASPWVAVLSLGAVCLLGALAYAEIGPRVAAGGFPVLNRVYMLMLLAFFLGFVLLDISYFERLTLRGFPTWIPLARGQMQLGLMLPGLMVTALLATLIALLSTYRVIASPAVLGVLAPMLLMEFCLVGLVGYACGDVAARAEASWRFRRKPALRLLLRLALLATFISLFTAYLALPMPSLEVVVKPSAALAYWALQTGQYAWVPLLTTSLILSGITIILMGRLSGEGVSDAEELSTPLSTVRSDRMPGNQMLAVGYLEALRLVRDRAMVGYLAASCMFGLLLVFAVGRGLLPLEHGASFLQLVLYMVTFLLAAVPLRARGIDLSTQWFWSSLPLHVGTYVSGKFLAGVSIPAIILATLLGISAYAGQVSLEGGLGELVGVFRFAWVAYAVAYVWGILYPYRHGDLTSEISQAGTYAVASFVLFRVLDALTPFLPGAVWVTAIGFSLLAVGLALPLEERLRHG